VTPTPRVRRRRAHISPRRASCRPEVSQVAKDTQAYFESGKASPALEFKSPIKGPALEQICIQVGTGQVDAKKGAELYDQDVKKQAQQLGLPGWE
jgi:raffinose/stachyose/melibiose transport system substrate-binding protein